MWFLSNWIMVVRVKNSFTKLDKKIFMRHTLSSNKMSKVHQRSLNLYRCVIPVPKFANRPFMSSNLFGCVIPVPKLANHPFRSSNLFSCVIPVPKLSFEFHLGQNRVSLIEFILKLNFRTLNDFKQKTFQVQSCRSY